MRQDQVFKRSGDRNRGSSDPNRHVIERFLLRLALGIMLVALVASEYPMVLLSGVMLITAMVTGAMALVLRETLNGSTLNHWDEALGFLALSFLFSAFAGPEVEQLLAEVNTLGEAGG